jgi:hypothetical protein
MFASVGRRLQRLQRLQQRLQQRLHPGGSNSNGKNTKNSSVVTKCHLRKKSLMLQFFMMGRREGRA